MSTAPKRPRVRPPTGRALVGARRVIELANRLPPVRWAGGRLCLRLAASTMAALRRHPDVAMVFARGSYGRGDPVPFLSDLDLVIITREPEGRPALRAVRSVQQALADVARANPLLRDRWHLVLGEGDLGLVARWAELFGVHEWSGDTPPPTSGEATPRRLSEIASWNRQHMWTDTAMRCAFAATTPSPRELLAFTAAEKKAAHHWARMVGAAPAPRRPLPTDEHELGVRCGRLVARLAETAVRLEPPPAMALETRAGVGDPFAADLDALLELPLLATAVTAVYRYEHSLVLVAREGEDLEALGQSLPGAARTVGRRLLLYPPSAAACAPLLGRLAELWRAPGGPGLPAEPAFLREQLFYEALHGSAELRLRAAVEADAVARRLCTARLSRWLAFLGQGRLLRSDDEAVAAAPPVDFDDAEAWFDAASGLWLELRTLLDGAAALTRPGAAERAPANAPRCQPGSTCQPRRVYSEPPED